MPAFDPKAAARFIADAHRQRTVYQNLPPEIAPSTVDEAYAAQEALRELWSAALRRVGRPQDRDHHEGHAAAHGHRSPVWRHDL